MGASLTVVANWTRISGQGQRRDLTVLILRRGQANIASVAIAFGGRKAHGAAVLSRSTRRAITRSHEVAGVPKGPDGTLRQGDASTERTVAPLGAVEDERGSDAIAEVAWRARIASLGAGLIHEGGLDALLRLDRARRAEVADGTNAVGVPDRPVAHGRARHAARLTVVPRVNRRRRGNEARPVADVPSRAGKALREVPVPLGREVRPSGTREGVGGALRTVVTPGALVLVLGRVCLSSRAVVTLVAKTCGRREAIGVAVHTSCAVIALSYIPILQREGSDRDERSEEQEMAGCVSRVGFRTFESIGVGRGYPVRKPAFSAPHLLLVRERALRALEGGRRARRTVMADGADGEDDGGLVQAEPSLDARGARALARLGVEVARIAWHRVCRAGLRVVAWAR